MGKIKTEEYNVPVLEFNTPDLFHSYILNEKGCMFDHIVQAIEYAMCNDIENIDVIRAEIKEPYSAVTIQARSFEWEKTLNYAMKHYIKKEYFEQCAKVRDLLEELIISK